MRSMFFKKSGGFFIVLVAIGLIGMGLGETVAAKELKIGFYDFPRLKHELPFFQKLTEIFKDKDAELENFRGNLYKEYLKFYEGYNQEIAKEKLGKPPEEQQQITKRFQNELNSKITELNEQLEKKRLQIEAFKNEETRAANDKFMELVAAVSKKKKLALVVEKSIVLYGGVDITQDIIKKVKKDEKQDKTK